MSEVSFFVNGVPVPQGSMRAFVNPKSGRPIVTSSNKGLAAWRRLVSDASQPHAKMFEGPIEVALFFRMPRIKSLPKTKPSIPTKKPDADKLVRSILDSLTGLFYTDDSQVTDLLVKKRYAKPEGRVGVQIRIRSVPEERW